MKVNLKKIGAIVAGATILASSAAFAGLMFGSTTLVDNNGAPVAKVVVGSKAHPSDGVAAALIAGKLVSETYKSQTLSAQVSGTASCKTGSSGNATSSGSGGCTITNEAVKLEITVPGSVATGSWSGTNLLGDYLNRELFDRKRLNTSDTDSAYLMSTGDTSDGANPFTDGSGSSSGNIGVSESNLYKVGGNQFSVFADKTLRDPVSTGTYVEKQALWLRGYNKYHTSKKADIGKVDFLAYSLKFDGPGGKEVGVPKCTNANSSNYAYCTTGSGGNSQYATATHKLKVWFLGEEWIISDMNPGTTALSVENRLTTGGDLKLAKESISGIVNQGENLPVDNLKFILDDLEAHGETTSAIISIVDANGNLLKKDTVPAGSTSDYTYQGKKYRFHVYKVAPGYTFGAKWADVAIFAKELKLQHGQRLDQDEDTNPGYKVALGWKNLDASSSATAPDALRTIVIYSEDVNKIASGGSNELTLNQYLKVVQDPEVWRLSYKGLDLKATDRYSLTFSLETSSVKDITQGDGPTNSSGGQMACKIFPPYVRVSSGKSGSTFTVTRNDGSSSGEISNNEFYLALNAGNTSDARTAFNNSVIPSSAYSRAVVCDNTNDGVYNITSDTTLGPATVFMKLSPSSEDYGYRSLTSSDGSLGGAMGIRYDAIGDGDRAFDPPYGGVLLVEMGSNVTNGSSDDAIGDLLRSVFGTTACDTANECGDSDLGNASASVPDVWFGLSEKAGTGRSNSYVDYFLFGINKASTGSPADALFEFSSASGSNDLTSNNNKIRYGHATASGISSTTNGNGTEFYGTSNNANTGPVDLGSEMVEEGYVSERGSVFRTIETTSVAFDMAHKLGKAQWWLAPASTNTSSASTSVVTLNEGDSATVSGVTVKVLNITETVGPCGSSGAASACTADMTGVSAVIMPDNKPSVSVAMPYSYGNYGNLVILDEDAVGVNTLVSVGGDKVNSKTAELLQGGTVDWSAERKVVKEVVQGSKIVVAGKDKEDTLEAAKDFVNQVKKV